MQVSTYDVKYLSELRLNKIKYLKHKKLSLGRMKDESVDDWWILFSNEYLYF